MNRSDLPMSGLPALPQCYTQLEVTAPGLEQNPVRCGKDSALVRSARSTRCANCCWGFWHCFTGLFMGCVWCLIGLFLCSLGFYWCPTGCSYCSVCLFYTWEFCHYYKWFCFVLLCSGIRYCFWSVWSCCKSSLFTGFSSCWGFLCSSVGCIFPLLFPRVLQLWRVLSLMS